MIADRLELLLVAQQRLRQHPDRLNAGHLYEIERAIEEIQGGSECSHTDTVERWVWEFLNCSGVG